MNTVIKLFKLLGATTLVVALSTINLSMKPNATSQTGSDLAQFADRISFFNEAQASTILATDIGGKSLANHIRFMYMLINGPGANGYPSGMSGPDGGFLGLIREITGPSALGGGLTNAGYSNCTNIPATGSHSMTDSEGTFKMYFESPVKTVPTGYTGAGSTFDKRVVVQFNGTTFMNIEFNCSTTVGWMRMAMGENGIATAPLRQLEIYYDTETAASSKLELYMTYEPGTGTTNGNEYFATKFETLSASTYKFWIIRAVDQDSGDQGFRAAAYGDSSTDVVNTYMAFVSNITDTSASYTTDNDTIFSGDLQCIDFSTPATPVESGSGCASLTMSDAGSPIIDAIDGTDGFDVEWVAHASGGMKRDMTSIAAPVSP